MFGQLLSLWTWKLKASLAVALIIAASWYVKHAETKAFDRGVAAGQQQLFVDQARQLETRAKEERAALLLERSDLNAAMRKLASDRATVEAQRRSLTSELNRGLSDLDRRDTVIRNEISGTPDSDLLPQVRDALSAIRRAEQSHPVTTQ
jgi:hypothetical protein